MITKTLLISDILTIKLHLDEQDLKNIYAYFPNMLIIDNDSLFDYEIYYHKIDVIPENYKITNGKEINPFRNSKYIINRSNDYIIAYAKKQKFSNEHAIIRNQNIILMYVLDDIKQKNLIRLMTELIIRKLLEKNYFPLHASCVVNENKAIIYIGKKGSGKSTALFSSVLLAGSNPLANDITFIGKENNIWKAFGTSYDLTFDSSLFSQITDGSELVEQHNLISEYNSNKMRYEASEFCRCFNTSWKWSASIKSINVVNLNPNTQYREKINIKIINALDYLNKYGKDHNFNFDDLLMINGLVPKFNYEDLVKEIIFNEIEGNIINHQLSNKVYKRSIYGRKN